MSEIKGLKCISCGKEYKVEGMRYLCEECGGWGTLVHHVKDHRGDMDLLVDLDNLMTLCWPCHNKIHANFR